MPSSLPPRTAPPDIGDTSTLPSGDAGHASIALDSEALVDTEFVQGRRVRRHLWRGADPDTPCVTKIKEDEES